MIVDLPGIGVYGKSVLGRADGLVGLDSKSMMYASVRFFSRDLKEARTCFVIEFMC